MRPDLRAQRCQILSKQRAHRHRQEDQSYEAARGGGEVVGGERRQGAYLARLGEVTQKPRNRLGAEFASHFLDAASQIGETARLCDSRAHQPDAVGRKAPFEDGRTYGLQTLLDRGPRRDQVLDVRVLAHLARHHSGEQRLFAAKSRIDRWLSCARDFGDLLDARAFEASLEKHPPGGVKDSLLNLAGEFPARPAAANHAAVRKTRVALEIPVHLCLFTSPRRRAPALLLT